MCYQLVEKYTACRCLYYQHAIDRCSAYGRQGHDVQCRTILVGYACPAHSSSPEGPPGSFRGTGGGPQTRVSPKLLGVHDILNAKPSEDILFGSDDVYGDHFDTKSVFSSFSAASATLTDLTLPSEEAQDTIPALFSDFLNEPTLRYLWPQVVIYSRTKIRSEVNIARFLRRFSEDLQKQADCNIKRDASKFISRSRWDIARRIFESHAAEIASSKPMPEWDPECADEAPPKSLPLGVEDETARIPYSELHRFLFSKEPTEGSAIDSLLFNVKSFVARGALASDAPVPELAPMRLLRQIHSKFPNQATKKPSPFPGAATLHWRCACGFLVSDRYLEKNEGGLAALSTLLDNYRSSTSALVQSISSTPPTASESSSITHMSGWIRSITQRKAVSKLPTHDLGTAKINLELRDTCQIASNQPASALVRKHKFLLACAPLMNLALKAHQPDVCNIHSDQQFFKMLRSLYTESRRGYKWTWLMKVASISFVKLEIFSSELADIKACPSVPDLAARVGYEFEPSDTDPPIGPNLLRHLYEHPDHAEVLPVLFNRVPKKMTRRLRACPTKGASTGWGIRLVEGPDEFVVFLCGICGFAASLVVSIIYTIAKEDIQGGFAVGAFLLAFCLYCAGSLRAMGSVRLDVPKG